MGISWLTALIMLALMGYFVYRLIKHGWELYKGQQSTSWPAVPCVILSSSVESKVVRSGRRRRTVYYPAIRYRYLVSGPELEGATVSFTPSFMGYDREAAYMTCEHYQVDSQHDVHYNPNKPAESVLQPGIHIATLPVLAILFEIAVMGFILWTLLTAEPGPFNGLFSR